MIGRLKESLRPYLPRNIKATLRARKDGQFAHTYLFSSKPAVVSLTWGTGRSVLHDEMKGRPLIVLYWLACWFVPDEIPPVAEEIKKSLKRHPQHRVIMLCNEEAMVGWFQAEGIEAIFCNHNAWVNEHCFSIGEGVDKKYDAIYNATMAPYKRHELAADVSSLALITYRYGNTHDTSYEDHVQKLLAHAAWVVDAHRDSEKATAAQVAALYHQSRTGLCLSAAEGAMFASIEYLLCGLPVVTTKNIGGRDVFFEPDYVVWVEDDPAAVADGVRNLISRAPSPEFIRARTLEKFVAHRQRLRDLLKGVVPHIEAPWPPGSHGPFTARDLKQLGRELREA